MKIYFTMPAKSQKKAISQSKREQDEPIDSIDLPSSDESEENYDDLEEFSGFASTDDEVEVDSEKSDKELAKIKELAEKSGSANSKPSKETGTVYIGRIPHGLYEDQLRAYLGQFGEITKLRVSRNKHTGKSKHYGFVEFASKEVARIVCETMDNYLLFGHLLKVKMMDASQIHEDLWIGANRKFHSIPWDTVRRQQLERKHPREFWQAKQDEFEAEKQAKARKLATLGIKY